MYPRSEWVGQRLPPGSREVVMNEETFNIEVRKFLKQVGVTSQREIESAVRRALEAGRLEGDEKLKVSARIQIEPIGLDHRTRAKSHSPEATPRLGDCRSLQAGRQLMRH